MNNTEVVSRSQVEPGNAVLEAGASYSYRRLQPPDLRYQAPAW